MVVGRIQINQKEITKTFWMISNWIKPFDFHVFYKFFLALWGLRDLRIYEHGTDEHQLLESRSSGEDNISCVSHLKKSNILSTFINYLDGYNSVGVQLIW